MAMSMRPGTDGDADTACCCYTFRRDSVYCRTILLLEDLKAAVFAECERTLPSDSAWDFGCGLFLLDEIRTPQADDFLDNDPYDCR